MELRILVARSATARLKQMLEIGRWVWSDFSTELMVIAFIAAIALATLTFYPSPAPQFIP